MHGSRVPAWKAETIKSVNYFWELIKIILIKVKVFSFNVKGNPVKVGSGPAAVIGDEACNCHCRV